MFKEEALDVQQYYDAWTDKFLAVYGNTIQAHRTADIDELHEYLIRSAELKDGQRIIDAGCGVCGPSVYFASKLDIHIDAVTVSEVQYQIARQRVAEAGLEHKISVYHSDYHLISDMFEADSYDAVLFLESFGHSKSQEYLISAVHDVLKPGGLLYIKDYFMKQAINAEEARIFDIVNQRTNDIFHYNVPDVRDVIGYIEKHGLELTSIIKPAFQDDFYEVNNTFNAINGIDVGMGDPANNTKGIFPINFFEVKANKRVYYKF